MSYWHVNVLWVVVVVVVDPGHFVTVTLTGSGCAITFFIISPVFLFTSMFGSVLVALCDSH